MMRSLRARRISSHLVSTKNLERFYCVPLYFHMRSSMRLHVCHMLLYFYNYGNKKWVCIDRVAYTRGSTAQYT